MRIPEKSYLAFTFHNPAKGLQTGHTLERCCICDRQVEVLEKAEGQPKLLVTCVKCLASYDPDDGPESVH
jgi:hypothetical protein